MRKDDSSSGSKAPGRWRAWWPLLAALLVWAAVAAWTWMRIRRDTGGILTYAGDDIYIDMAIAKNLVQHAVWGVTSYAFTSSASSLIWPVLLAATYLLFGVNNWAPLALSLLFSLVLLVVAYRIARGHGASPWVILLVLLAVIFFVPLTAIVFAGLETVLQVLLGLVFAEAVRRELIRPRWAQASGDPSSENVLVALAICLTLVRYEGMFLALAGALLLAWQRRFRLAGTIIAGSLLPVVGWAVFSLAKGWYPLPNSILVKSAPFSDIIPETPAMTLTRAIRFATGKDFILSLVLGVLLLWAIGWVQGSREKAFYLPGLFFFLVVLQHGTLIDIEWFYRHAAYLVVLGIWALEATHSSAPRIVFQEVLPAKAVSVGLCGLLLLYPFLVRGTSAVVNTAGASFNIYEMQYQMGLFLQQDYPGQAVAANDIGAIDYLNDLHLVDLYGLASMDVARAKLSGRFTTSVIERVTATQDVRVAIVYDLWYAQVGLPPSWVKVREWRYHDCIVCGEDTVSFYALSRDQVAPLESALSRYSRQLPRSVQDVAITP